MGVREFDHCSALQLRCKMEGVTCPRAALLAQASRDAALRSTSVITELSTLAVEPFDAP